MKKHNVSDEGLLKISIISGCGAAIISALLAMLCAYFVVEQIVVQEMITWLTPLITVISALSCSLFAAKKVKVKKILAALGTVAVYFAITLIGKMAFFPGKSIYLFRNGILCIIAGLIAAAIVCLPRKKRSMKNLRRR